ncbi:M23 family metallopeptidase, partial [bacterium]|nr:M23 family metallopeptidase [bacterium]
NKFKILLAYSIWFGPYLMFIIFFTGPVDLSQYPPQETSPFKLPWSEGDIRFVSQGNRSFTSHRGLHLNAWDFVMPIGTPVLASGEGDVVRVEMYHDGIGLLANIIVIEHANGIRTGYAHLKKDSAQVKLGDHVKQGQLIALSGLVGQTPFPHLHFFATDSSGTEPRPISFKEVPGGIPFAGHFYSSENTEH